MVYDTDRPHPLILVVLRRHDLLRFWLLFRRSQLLILLHTLVILRLRFCIRLGLRSHLAFFCESIELERLVKLAEVLDRGQTLLERAQLQCEARADFL